MNKLRLVRDNATKTKTKYKTKKREVKSMSWLKQFKKEYKEWNSFDETPVQQMKPKKLKHRIIPEEPKTEFECRVVQNPFELKKMGYEPSKSCWENFYKSRLSVVKNEVKQTNQVFKKVA